jgi:Tfp pilus assembly pilus retraction ATPase PilT
MDASMGHAETFLPSLSSLQLVPVLAAALAARRGLLVCTGPARSGKSTTLAALGEGLSEAARRLVVVQDEATPGWEREGRGGPGGIVHREVGGDPAAMRDALRMALRMDADVVVLDPLPPALFEAALQVAEAGVLVLGTYEARDCAAALSCFAAGLGGAPEAARERLGRSLVCALNLRRCRGGAGVVLASEVLLAGIGLSAALREGSGAAIQGYIAGGRHLGMRTLGEGLADLLAAGRISEAEAWAQANDKRRFAHPLLSPTPPEGVP